jgi:hypothetical protein
MYVNRLSMTEPIILGLYGLHAGLQQPCCVSQAILLANISPGCDFLSRSKPWLSVIGFPNFMLTPLPLFLYPITRTLIFLVYYYPFRKCTCSPILLSLEADYNPMAWCAHVLLVLPSQPQNPELSAHNLTPQHAKVLNCTESWPG